MSALARWSQRLAALAAMGPVRWAFFTTVTAAALWPYLRTAGAFNDFRDAHVLWLYEDAARRSVLTFGQLPLWNPDFCGGLPALGTPQSRFASPTFLLTLLFGTTRAEPLTLFVMVLTAMGGTFRYARARHASRLGATLAAPVFALMGIFACAPFLGWFGFLGFALLPWVLVGTRQAARGEVQGAALIAFATAWMVGFGGTYVAPISLAACALEVVLLAATRSTVRWPTLALALLLSLGVSAFRLWPVWEELQRAPRVVAGLSAFTLDTLGSNLFGARPLFGSETWYFVGIPATVVAALALRRRRIASLVVAFVVWVWVALGSAATPSLYNLLRRLPVFSLLRNSERFLVPAVLVLAVGAALAVTELQARLRLRHRSARDARLTAAGWLVAVGGLVLSLPWQGANFALAASKRTLVPPPVERPRPFHQARGNRWAAGVFGPMSRGSLACWEAYAVPQSPLLRADAATESWLADPTAGQLVERRWSPQQLDFAVTLERPTRLVINQNYHRGWKSTVGQVVSEQGLRGSERQEPALGGSERWQAGLLAVELPAGTHEVSLRFSPTSAIGGAWVSLLAAALALALLRWRAPLGVQLLSASAPLALAAALAWASNEPPLPAREPVGPDGEALVATQLPSGATPLKVRFAGDVTLEGVSLLYRPSDDRVRLELDWSHGAAVNRRLGFFVHIEPGGLKRITADHLQLSDTLFLEEGPDGRVLRDIMLVDVPASKRGEPWNVWVGVWEMRGTGDRLRVTDANGVRVKDERVFVGTLTIPPDASEH